MFFFLEIFHFPSLVSLKLELHKFVGATIMLKYLEPNDFGCNFF